LTVDYSRGVINGSGILVGSNGNQVQTAVGRRLSRYWSGNLNFGYARNGNLGNPSASTVSQAIDSYYIGSALSRPIGRDSDFTIAYTALIQNSTQPLCATGTCERSYTEHLITLGFSWRARPFVLR
jgi:hypothetical protein